MTDVQFKLTKSANSRAAVLLIAADDSAQIKLVFDANGAAHAELDGALGYTAAWALVGAMGDTIKLTWKTPGGNSGTAINAAITEANSIPYPGGRRRAEDMGGIPPVGV